MEKRRLRQGVNAARQSGCESSHADFAPYVELIEMINAGLGAEMTLWRSHSRYLA
jgi:hypothetical protein